jgi:hypothetical protein
VISLCVLHHREQHLVGEAAFERKHCVDLAHLASEFARRSPHWRKLRVKCSDLGAGVNFVGAEGT